MTSTPQNFSQLVGIFKDLIYTTMPVLAGLSLLFFIWGLVKFIAKAGDEKSHKEGIALMKWGLLALFIMLSFTAIIAFFYGDFGFAVNKFGSRLPQ